jgi:hypothetical protein
MTRRMRINFILMLTINLLLWFNLKALTILVDTLRNMTCFDLRFVNLRSVFMQFLILFQNVFKSNINYRIHK